jgi:hypothetical protein
MMIQREILSIHGRDMVIVRWRLVSKKPTKAALRVRPKLTGRDYHGTHHENGHLSTEAHAGSGMVMWHGYADLLQCGPSTPERIGTNRLGIGTYNSPLNSNVGSIPKKIGGCPESSHSSLRQDPPGP